MFCNRCGAVNVDDSLFCSDCGGPITSSTSGKKSASGARATEFTLPIGSILANRYRILEILGEGGMGCVYLAEDQQLETRVAIKVLRDVLSRDPGSVKRLIAEARHSMTLSHPNVVRVHNFEDGEMFKFLVMEYVEGGTLAGRIFDKGKLSEEEARRIAIEACKGLEHAHEQRLIHRDIKPLNILIGKSGTVKIADFGIARVCRDSASRLNSQVDSGTLLYMSPEQLIGKSNEASDIYSLGVVLYEMLTGQPPFQSGDITYQIRQIVPDPPEGVPLELSAIVLKCLEKKPECRYQTVRELREELDGTAAAKRKEEERHAAELRRVEEESLRAELRRSTEEARQHEEEAQRKQEDAHRREEERKQSAVGLAAACSLLDRGAFVEAEAKLQEAVRLDPSNAEATAALARCRDGKAATHERGKHQPPPAPVVTGKRKSSGRRAATIAFVVLGVAIISWYSISRGRMGVDETLLRAKTYWNENQYDQALPLFRRAVEAGNEEAAVYLGVMYQNGQGGLPKDEVQAVSWFRKAAEAGDAHGMSSLGAMYENGQGGLPKDDAQAASWFRKAAEAGDAQRMASLGYMYRNGKGGLPKDDAQGVSWFRKAAEAGNAHGMAALGYMYSIGRGGLPQDDVQAVSWFRKAAEAGDAYGMSCLGIMLENGEGGLPKDEAQALSWFRKAAESGDAAGMAGLGGMLVNGRGGLQKDDVQALSWFRKAAEAGSALAMSDLGAMYENGRGGLQKDDVQAVSWYRKAAEAGDAHGMSYLGDMYENGKGGLPKDDAQAVSWFHKAADLGDTYAQESLKRLGR